MQLDLDVSYSHQFVSTVPLDFLFLFGPTILYTSISDGHGAGYLELNRSRTAERSSRNQQLFATCFEPARTENIGV